MVKFIWISGSINSGKSTIAKLLADKIENAVNIELDALSHFNKKLSIEVKSDFIIEDALILAANWVSRGFLPILNWPLWGNQLEFMVIRAKELGLAPAIINLVPDVDIVKKNRGHRPLTQWELDRIDYMYNTGKINEPKYGFNIDNGYLNVLETMDKILITLQNDSFGI